MMTSVPRTLPRMKQEEIRVWDDSMDVAGGYLFKKASGGIVGFNKGKFQKRWFILRLDYAGLAEDENYTLEYYYHPDDRNPRERYPLAYAELLLSGNNTFTLTTSGKEKRMKAVLRAESHDVLEDWYQTLEKAIDVATLRENIAQEKRALNEDQHSDVPAEEPSGEQKQSESPTKDKKGIVSKGEEVTIESSNVRLVKPQIVELDEEEEDFSKPRKKNPCVRLDIDINSIPPSSAQRRQFEDIFQTDLARVLRIDADMIKVYSVRPAVGMDWLVSVEFDIFVYAEENEEEDDEDDEKREEDERFRDEKRVNLLQALQNMVMDTASPLYLGFVTCKIDPTFHTFISDYYTIPLEPYSADPVVFNIMRKYADVEVPKNELDFSHFTIFLTYKDELMGDTKTGKLRVPNPLVLRRRSCFIWPFEVKEALGLLGTFNDQLMTPLHLIMKGRGRDKSQPIVFEPSARIKGDDDTTFAINASKLQSGVTYEVYMEDKREDYILELKKTEAGNEQLRAIGKKFIDFDKDGNNHLDRTEVRNMILFDIEEKRSGVEQRFNDFLKDGGHTAEEIRQAADAKDAYLENLKESEQTMLQMYDSSDANHDRRVSLPEFLLVETYWLRRTIDKEKAHLFLFDKAAEDRKVGNAGKGRASAHA